MYLYQVGLACCQFYSAYGCIVVGTAGTNTGMEAVKKAGALHTFNHRHNNYQEEIKVGIL